MGNAQTSVDQFPMDAVLSVLVQLPSKTLMGIPSVSKGFRKCFDQESLWTRFCIEWLHHPPQLDPKMGSWKHQFVYNMCCWGSPGHQEAGAERLVVLSLLCPSFPPLPDLTSSTAPFNCLYANGDDKINNTPILMSMGMSGNLSSNPAIWRSRISKDTVLMLGYGNSFVLYHLKEATRQIRVANPTHALLPYGAYLLDDYQHLVPIERFENLMVAEGLKYRLSDPLVLQYITLAALQYVKSCQAAKLPLLALQPSDLYVRMGVPGEPNMVKFSPRRLIAFMHHLKAFPNKPLSETLKIWHNQAYAQTLSRYGAALSAETPDQIGAFVIGFFLLMLTSNYTIGWNGELIAGRFDRYPDALGPFVSRCLASDPAQIPSIDVLLEDPWVKDVTIGDCEAHDFYRFNSRERGGQLPNLADFKGDRKMPVIVPSNFRPTLGY